MRPRSADSFEKRFTAKAAFLRKETEDFKTQDTRRRSRFLRRHDTLVVLFSEILTANEREWTRK